MCIFILKKWSDNCDLIKSASSWHHSPWYYRDDVIVSFSHSARLWMDQKNNNRNKRANYCIICITRLTVNVRLAFVLLYFSIPLFEFTPTSPPRDPREDNLSDADVPGSHVGAWTLNSVQHSEQRNGEAAEKKCRLKPGLWCVNHKEQLFSGAG